MTAGMMTRYRVLPKGGAPQAAGLPAAFCPIP